MIILQTMTEPHYDERGRLYAWRNGPTIKEFRTKEQAMQFVDENILLIPDNATFFTGSASVLGFLSEYLRVARECRYEVAL